MDVLAGWETQGCGPAVAQRLGYRLTAERVRYPPRANPGESLAVSVDLVNRGFAAPFNERSVYAVLLGAGTRHVVRLDADPRRWYGGATAELATKIALPADLAPGVYSVALWLPDPAARLTDDPRYAIRLANRGTWDEATGYNVLIDDIVVGGE